MAFSGFVARYREPMVQEGFQDITKVNFKVSGCSHGPRLIIGVLTMIGTVRRHRRAESSLVQVLGVVDRQHLHRSLLALQTTKVPLLSSTQPWLAVTCSLANSGTVRMDW
jgi:hypothetical protein